MYPSSFSNLARQGMAQGIYHRQPAHALPQQASPMAMQNHAMMGGQVQPPNGLLGRPMGPMPQQAPQGFDQQAWANSNFTNPGAPNYVDPAGVGGRIRAAQAAGNPYAAGMDPNMFDGGQQQRQSVSMPPNPYAQNSMNSMNSAMGQQPNGQAGMGNYGMQFQGQPQQPMGGPPNPYGQPTSFQSGGGNYRMADGSAVPQVAGSGNLGPMDLNAYRNSWLAAAGQAGGVPNTMMGAQNSMMGGQNVSSDPNQMQGMAMSPGMAGRNALQPMSGGISPNPYAGGGSIWG